MQLALIALAIAQQPFVPEIKPASDAAQQAIRRFELAPGLQAELIAAEPDLANPVALDVDAQGRIWVCETFRLRKGVFDMRDHRRGVDDDLACNTVEDRIAMMHKLWPKDIETLQVASERVRLLRDTDGDGVLESTVFADGFSDLAHGLASGVMAWGDDVWFTCLPELWRLRDTDGDGVADEREAVHTGFGVRFQFIGHDMHGLRVGPDRRLYFSIGDRGLSVPTENGRIECTQTGAVLRCELDGSNLELFATGLRNPQELAFDQHGNLFTGDNNSDSGDKARWVYLVEGSDSGWRCGYQWMPDRGPWNREKLWHPHHVGQPAWIVPPIANVINGPSGLTYYPGTGLPDRYDDTFFLCEFRASQAVSGVYAFRNVPKGASFELAAEERFAWRVCATDVEFGYDGGLYLSDWVEGWGLPQRGRVYRVHDPKISNSTDVTDTGQLMREGMRGRSENDLVALLRHIDMRVRLAAQFELVDRGALDPLAQTAKNPNHRLARLHGIWGVGCLGRKDSAACAKIQDLLRSTDFEVVAQTARACGDAGFAPAADAIAKLSKHRNSRVRQFASHALAKIGTKGHVAALLQVLRDNGDRDAHLRHAAIMGLAGIGDEPSLVAAGKDQNAAVRRGVLIALTRMKSDAVAGFLEDADDTIAREAARSIYRDVESSMPALAAQIRRVELTDASLGRRVLNANRHLGTNEAADALAMFVLRGKAPTALRVEALEILGEWSKPGSRDRVFGRWRPVAPRENPKHADVLLAESLGTWIDDEADNVANTAIRLSGSRGTKTLTADIERIARDRKRHERTRVAALDALDALKFEGIEGTLAAVTREDPVSVRNASVRLLSKHAPEATVPLLESLCEDAGRRERQNAMRSLGKSKAASADSVVARWAERLARGDVPRDMQLEVLEAAEARKENGTVAQHLDAYTKSLPANDMVAPYLVALEGGNKGAGRRLFRNHAAAQCTRCHMVADKGGQAGPNLDKLGERATRAHILESLVNPMAKIAEGYAMTVVEKTGGGTAAGTAIDESDGWLTLADAAGNLTRVNTDHITSRSTQKVSTMPPMGGILNRRQLRDVVEFLATLK